MRFYAYSGILLWLAATLLFRFWGGELIQPGTILIWLSFGLIIPGIPLLMLALFRFWGTAPQDRPKAALLVAVPGMLLDLLTLMFHGYVFPGISDAHLHLFFVWLMWAYALILLAGLYLSRRTAKAV
ncbi:MULTISPECIES: DUF5367 family protein [Paenibacillus]|uniref:DUF5367 family protein n=1 Tax=Paenibacillus TaxID=44249 RepID=UPI002FDF6BAC